MNFKIKIANESNPSINGWFGYPFLEDLIVESLELQDINHCFIMEQDLPFEVEETETIKNIHILCHIYETLPEDLFKYKDIITEIFFGGDDISFLEEANNIVFYKGKDICEVTDELLDNGYLGELTEKAKNFIDKEKLSDYLERNMCVSTKDGIFYWE